MSYIKYLAIMLLIAATGAISNAQLYVAPPGKISPAIQEHRQLKVKGANKASLIERGVLMSQPATEECAYYVAGQLSASQKAELAKMGVIIHDTYVPPVGKKFPFGYHMATVPYAALDALIENATLVRLDTVEISAKPHNDLANDMTQVTGIHAGTGLPSAYDGTGVKVAVADSGFDLTHADLPTPVEAYDVTDGVGVANWDTDVSNQITDHGTHVLGTIGGDGTLSGGTYTGVAPGASYYLYKIGNDASGNASSADIIEAISRAVTMDCDIFSMSYGGWQYYNDGSDPLSQAIDAATAAGVACFISSGNAANDDIHDTVDVAGSGSSTFYFTIDNSWGGSDYETGHVFRLNWIDGTASDNNITMSCSNLGTTETLISSNEGYSTLGTEGRTYTLAPSIAAGVSKTYSFAIANSAAGAVTVQIYLYSGDGTFDSPDAAYTIGAPALADTAISIGAWVHRANWTDYTGGNWTFNQTINTLTSFSSQGPRIDGLQKPDICAPGSAMISARDSGTGLAGITLLIIDNDGVNDGNGPANYYVKQGTSMACPHAAGIAALAIEADPTLTPALLRTKMRASSSLSDAPTDAAGYGLIDAMTLIQSLVPVELSGFSIE